MEVWRRAPTWEVQRSDPHWINRFLNVLVKREKNFSDCFSFWNASLIIDTMRNIYTINSILMSYFTRFTKSKLWWICLLWAAHQPVKSPCVRQWSPSHVLTGGSLVPTVWHMYFCRTCPLFRSVWHRRFYRLRDILPRFFVLFFLVCLFVFHQFQDVDKARLPQFQDVDKAGLPQFHLLSP